MPDLLLFAAGLAASSVNAAAGGGTLLSFPALLAAGLSPLSANATSTVGLLTGYIASTAEYRRELRRLRGDVVFTLAPSLLGGVTGAVLLLALGGAFFARIVPALLLGSSALLLCQPLVARMLRERPRVESAAGVLAAIFVISVYGGYFGAGVGILFLAAMGFVYTHDLGQVNAIKVFVSLVANVVAALVFAGAELLHPTGSVSWRAAAPLALGSIAGGYVGTLFARRLPSWALASFAAVVGVCIAVYFLIRR